MAGRPWRGNRLALVVGALALLAGVPAALTAAEVRSPWLLGAVTAASAVIVVFGVVSQERYKRLVERRDEQDFRVQDGCLVLADGRLPTVRDVADPVKLGVHQATVTFDGHLVAPAYVPRDIDEELREQLAAGGFVVLVGDSTAGKSRAAFEVVSSTLPSHVLICPSSRDAIPAAVDRAARERRCVLWLDDLERYLGVGGLTPIQLARLLTGEGHHRVIVATIRTAEQARIAVEMAEDEAGRQLSRDARQVFDQAYPIRISRMFSNQEIDRAQARNWDSRIAVAVDHADSYGLAEYLAAGPQLLRDWQNARESSEGGNVRGAALIAAAVDMRRAGYTSPIPRSLLGQVHEHYLSDAEYVHLPREHEDQAWEWATCRRLATAALLRPVGADVVEVFDYLVDTIQRQAGILRPVPGPIVEAAIAFADPAECDSLAFTAYYQGRYALARQAWQNAYQSRSDDPALGPDHPDTLTSRNNLAIALVACGQFSEAEYEYREVLKGRTRVLSPDHPRTLSTRSSLAETLHARGQMDEAEQELRAVLKDSAQVFGPEHPDTLSVRSGLAGILHDRGQFDEAIQEYRALLEASTQLLGSDDPDTLVLRHNLARNLLDSGQLDEAEAENRAIAQIRSRTLGPDHPLTLTNRLNIALILHDRGLLSDARTENTAVLEASTRVLGPDHPQTLLTRSNLAEILLELGQLDEAEREIHAVLQARTLVLGPDHPSTLIDRHYLARLLRMQGQLSEAERELRAVLEARTRVLGPDHPRTLNARNDLAEITLSRQSPIAEAGDPDQALPT